MEGVLKQVFGRMIPLEEEIVITEEYQDSQELVAAMDEISTCIKSAESCFRNVTDDNLIDACIYEIASLKARYSYLLRLAKEKAIVCPLN